MEGSESFFYSTNFSMWNFIYKWKLLHTLKETGIQCLSCGLKFSDSQIPVDFTSSGGEIYPCPCQSERFWAECYDSKLNYHTVTLTEMPSSGGGDGGAL